jgi:hypothetical protein
MFWCASGMMAQAVTVGAASQASQKDLFNQFIVLINERMSST